MARIRRAGGIAPGLPQFNVLSFVFVGIYWNNHHHLACM